MKNSILLALFGIAVISTVPARASTAGFDFTQCNANPNSYGSTQTETSACGVAGYSNTSNSFSQTVTGVGTVTATAYTTLTGAGDTGTAGTPIESGTNAYVGQYTGNGLGECSIGDSGFNSGTPSAGCTNGPHQVDDQNSYEFILFTFTTPVNLNTITLANFGDGSLSSLGITYEVNPTSLTTILSSATTVVCGGSDACPAAEGNGSGIGVGSWTTGNLGLTNVSTLLVGADTSETSDFFKIQGLGGVADFNGAKTPEPATFGLLGLSLAGFGLLRRKRKLN